MRLTEWGEVKVVVHSSAGVAGARTVLVHEVDELSATLASHRPVVAVDQVVRRVVATCEETHHIMTIGKHF